MTKAFADNTGTICGNNLTDDHDLCELVGSHASNKIAKLHSRRIIGNECRVTHWQTLPIDV